MTEPVNTAGPIIALGGLSGFSVIAGLDQGAVIAAFGGALMFAFIAKDTAPMTRIFCLLGAWIFGYYAGVELVSREFLQFKTPPIPSFVAAFFCVALFKLLLAMFDKEGKAWVRKKLGLSTEGPDK